MSKVSGYGLQAVKIFQLLLLNFLIGVFYYFLFRPVSIQMYELRANPLFNFLFSLRDFFPEEFYLYDPLRNLVFLSGAFFLNLSVLNYFGFDVLSPMMNRLKKWIELQREKRRFVFLIFWSGLIFFPFVATFCLILKYSVVIPFMDTWISIDCIENSFLGKLSFHDLWDWHGAGFHRNFFPRLLEVIVAHLFHWELIYINFVTLILAGVTFILIAVRFVGKKSNLLSWASLLSLPALSIILFSARLKETWIWDQGFVSYICIAPVILACFIMTSSHTLSWKQLLFGVILGAISNSSFSAGVAFWPVGFYLILTSKNNALSKTLMGLTWFVASVLFLRFYFTDYTVRTIGMPLLSFLREPSALVAFFLVYLGGTFPKVFVAGVLGFVGLIYFGFSLFQQKAQPDEGARQRRFFLAMGLFAFVAGLFIAIGRYFKGPPAALSFNYANFSNLFFIAFLGLFFIKFQGTSFKEKVQLRVSAFAMVLLIILHLISFSYYEKIKETSNFINQHQNQLEKGENLEALITVSQVPHLLPHWLEILKRRNLNLFY